MNKFHDLKGEQKNQLLITTDKNGTPVGTAPRIDCHKGDGKSHLAFLAVLFDGQGNIYIQKRSKRKSLWDGYWDASIVSHVLPGETIEMAAARRGKEELGVAVNFKDIGAFYYFAKYQGNCENEYCHVLVGKTLSTVYPNPIEIDMIKKITINELKSDMNTKSTQYTPWLQLAFKKYGHTIYGYTIQ